MEEYIQKGGAIKAMQWNKQGDSSRVFNMTGGDNLCAVCGIAFKYHGAIYRNKWKRRRLVCPGNYIYEKDNELYSMHPDKFCEEYEAR